MQRCSLFKLHALQRLLKCKLVLVALLFAIGGQAFAQQSDINIGFVNIRRIMNEAPQLEEISNRLSGSFADEHKRIAELEEELSKLGAEYNQTTSNDDAIAVQKKISSTQREINQIKDTLNDEFSLRRNEEISAFQQLIVQTVAEISKEKQLDLVLNNTGVVYVNARVDITNDVLNRLKQVGQQ